jgi:hypothetical protein
MDLRFLSYTDIGFAWYCLRHGLLGSREVRLAFLCAFRNWDVDLRRSFFLEMTLVSRGRAVLRATESSRCMEQRYGKSSVVMSRFECYWHRCPVPDSRACFGAALLEI